MTVFTFTTPACGAAGATIALFDFGSRAVGRCVCGRPPSDRTSPAQVSKRGSPTTCYARLESSLSRNPRCRSRVSSNTASKHASRTCVGVGGRWTTKATCIFVSGSTNFGRSTGNGMRLFSEALTPATLVRDAQDAGSERTTSNGSGRELRRSASCVAPRTRGPLRNPSTPSNPRPFQAVESCPKTETSICASLECQGDDTARAALPLLHQRNRSRGWARHM